MQKPITHFPSSRPTPTYSLWAATLEIKPCFPPSFSFFTSIVITEHSITWYRTSFVPVWVNCPGNVISQSLAHPQLIQGVRTRVTKQSWCRCSAHQQENLLGCHQNCFSCKSKTYRLLWRNSTPSQTCYTIMLLHLNFENKLSPSELRVFLQTVFSITTAYSKVLVLQSLAIY